MYFNDMILQYYVMKCLFLLKDHLDDEIENVSLLELLNHNRQKKY